MNDYLEAFYDRYARYLDEGTVTVAHSQILRMIASTMTCSRILDLGCGKQQEIKRRLDHSIFTYVGVDKNVRDHYDHVNTGWITRLEILVQDDYRNLSLVKNLTEVHRINMICSLFSS